MDERGLMQNKDFLDKIIGGNIAKERILRNMSREELAELMDINVAHLGLIERGKRGVVAHTFYTLWCIFDTPLEGLFNISSETNLEEHFAGGKQLADNRKKIMSLLTYLSEEKIELVVDIIKAINRMESKSKKNAKDKPYDE